MPRTRRYDITDLFEKISLSQKISAADPHIKDYVGADVELARSIALIHVLRDEKIVSEELTNLALKIMIEENKSTFASSEKTDIYSKLGLMLPKAERVIYIEDEDD